MLIFATITHQKTSLGWKFQKLYQQVSEWVMLKLGNWNPDIPNVPDWSFPFLLLQILFWVVVVVLVGWCSWLLYQLLMRYWPAQFDPNLMGRSQAAPSPRAPRSIADWLKIAQSCQQQGNYPEACRALYMAMIARLHDTQLIPEDRSRTDGEYHQLVAQLPQSEHYQTLLQTHEELQFGNMTLSGEHCQRCQRAYAAIEQGLSQ